LADAEEEDNKEAGGYIREGHLVICPKFHGKLDGYSNRRYALCDWPDLPVSGNENREEICVPARRRHALPLLGVAIVA